MIYFIISIIAVTVYTLFLERSIIINWANYTIKIDTLFIIFFVLVIVALLIYIMRSIIWCILKVKNYKIKKKENLLKTLIENFCKVESGNFKDLKRFFSNNSHLYKPDFHSLFTLLKLKCALNFKDYESIKTCLGSLINSKFEICGQILTELVEKLKTETEKDRITLLESFIESFHLEPFTNILKYEVFILRKNWSQAIIAFKTAEKNNFKIDYQDNKHILNILYVALATKYYDEKDWDNSLKTLNNLSEDNYLYRIINILKAKIYFNTNKKEKAFKILEETYKDTPSIETSNTYLELNNHSNRALQKLCDLNPNYYFSQCLLLKNNFNCNKNSIVLNNIEKLLQKHNYISIYLLVIQLNLIANDISTALRWVNKALTEAKPDPHWNCINCNKTFFNWNYECNNCKSFNTFIYRE